MLGFGGGKVFAWLGLGFRFPSWGFWWVSMGFGGFWWCQVGLGGLGGGF